MFKKKSSEKKTEKQRVEERREEVLKSGRKFKYPLQYAKHKTMFFSIIVGILALVGLSAGGYYALYKANSSSDILYRLTTVLPIPVAKVDDENVRYSDYMLIYKSTITPVEQQQGKLGNDADGDAMRAHYQRSALTDAENYAYAGKLARELDITVSKSDVDEAIASHRKVGGVERSEESFTKILKDNFGISMDEYRRMIYLSLVKTKVAERIDSSARKLSEEIEAKIRTPAAAEASTEDKPADAENSEEKPAEETKPAEVASDVDLLTIANELGEKVLYEETGGLVDQMNVDGGRAAVAMSLEPGQVSSRFVSTSGDGYYFVKLIEKTDSTVNYSSIKVPFTAFSEKLSTLRDDHKIEEYITLAEDAE